MLELSTIFVASRFGLASELFGGFWDPGNTLPDGRSFRHFVAMDCAACIDRRWVSIIGPRCLRCRKWSKRGGFGG